MPKVGDEWKPEASSPLSGYLLLINGKKAGKITAYDATTGTLSFKRLSWWWRLRSLLHFKRKAGF